MNVRRVAEIHREIAQLHQELAAEMSSEDVPVEETPRARRRARPHPAPLNPVSDTDRMRATGMLRRRGITT